MPKFRSRLYIVLFSLMLSFSWAIPALGAGESFMKQGEELFKQRTDVAKAEQSAVKFRQAIKLRPNDPEAYWKLARSLCWVAEQTHDNKSKRLKDSTEAMNAGLKAVELAPNSAAAHFFLGLSYVYYGDTKGIFEVAGRWKEVKYEFEKVIELEPGFLGGAAYMLLGRAYYYVPGFMGGGRQNALDYYQKALHYGPRQFGTHVYLAEHYINNGELEKARALLQQVLDGPPMKGQEPEWEEWKPEAEHYMRKIAEKEAKLAKKK